MGSDPAQRRLLVTAAAVIAVWLGAVVGATVWRYPEFWVSPPERFARATAYHEEGRTHEAIVQVRAAIAKDPRHADYRIFEGYRLLELNEPAAAEASFRAALERRGDRAEARLGLADALTRQGRRDEALGTLEPLQAADLTRRQLRHRSQLYGLLRAPGPALADLSHLLQSETVDVEALEEAVVHATSLGDWTQVVSLTDRLQGAPLTPDSRRRAAGARADALHALGRPAEAFESYRRADRPDDLERRAGLAWSLGHYDEAAGLYRELMDRHPGDLRFRRAHASVLLAGGRRPEADGAFRELLSTGAADAATRQTYAWMLNAERRHAEAWRAIEPLPRPAQDPALLDLQARTAVWARRLPEAMQLLPALLRLRPDDAGLWRELASVAEQAGHPRAAADALASYLRLQAQDAAARQRLAEILARAGFMDAAVREYRRLLAANPDDARTAAALGLLHETAGRLEEAKTAYLQAVQSTADSRLYLRLARLHRWTGDHPSALDWYEQYIKAVDTADALQQARVEVALSLLEAGDAGRSLAVLQDLERDGRLDAEAILTAARAASAMRNPALAATYLEALSATRPLTYADASWLAGAYRAAGQPARALEQYERLRAVRPDDPAVLDAVADLRFDAGEYAAALEALRRIEGQPGVRLKLARTAARAGDLAAAERAFRAYAADHPADAEAQLEAARFFAASGDPARAIRFYADAIRHRGSDCLRLELARIHMAAGRFDTAERWARHAVAAGESPEESELALAQALHVQGENAEAEALLRSFVRTRPAHGDAHAWRGRIAVAMDRHYAAYQSFDRALPAADRGERLALLMATAARKRGDLARARASLDHAARLGAEPALLANAREELQEAAGTTISFPAWIHADSNELHLSQSGLGLTFFLPRLAGSVGVTATSGALSQGGFTTTHTGVSLSLDQIFLTPALELSGRAGLHQFSGAADLATWEGTATWHVSDEVRAGATIARVPLLPLAGPTPLRQFNRVLDLRAVSPNVSADAVQGFTEFLTRRTHRVRAQGGAERLADGNRQAFAYGHYQLPVATGVRQWTVLRPNVFYERFARKSPAYFSPSSHLTLGTMLHTIRQYPGWDLEVELNPQLLRTEGMNGFGGHGVVNLTLRKGRTTMNAGTFLFYDGLENYLQWRAGGRVTVRVGR